MISIILVIIATHLGNSILLCAISDILAHIKHTLSYCREMETKHNNRSNGLCMIRSVTE